MLSRAKYKSGDSEISSQLTSKISINVPTRKNEFSKRKKWLLNKLEDDNFLSGLYEESKEILFSAAEQYAKNTSKEKVTLFKNRSFDKDYLIQEIENQL